MIYNFNTTEAHKTVILTIKTLRCPYLRTDGTREARGTSWASGTLKEESRDIKW